MVMWSGRDSLLSNIWTYSTTKTTEWRGGVRRVAKHENLKQQTLSVSGRVPTPQCIWSSWKNQTKSVSNITSPLHQSSHWSASSDLKLRAYTNIMRPHMFLCSKWNYLKEQDAAKESWYLRISHSSVLFFLSSKECVNWLQYCTASICFQFKSQHCEQTSKLF